ncbi:MAG: glucose-6-phosphate dehydrogenase [Actinomycetota bacterium]
MIAQLPPNQTLVVFGASGDLTARKVMPALYNLFKLGLLPEQFSVVGYARTPMDDSQFRGAMREAVANHGGQAGQSFEESVWQGWAPNLSYVQGDYSSPEDLSRVVGAVDPKVPILFYCATPPSEFPGIITGLGSIGMPRGSRIVIEKPFGHDLKSAKELNALLHDNFAEKDIFRIDHYLGKENVQNILVFRFSNGMFEPIWNRMYVSSVQIDVAEDLGIGRRGKFYEQAGAIRDIVQNHILQLLATLMMEPPSSFDAESIRDEKVKVLRAVTPIDPDAVVRGQYVGYRQEAEVAGDSQTETFIAARMGIENWRWAGVPIYIRTGKRLARRATTISVTFHDAPHMLFEESGMLRPEPNHLTIRIQPDEGITITFDAKIPGPEMRIQPVDMSFDYDRSFDVAPPEAYERLLLDAMQGDRTLFTRADEVERSWEIVADVLTRTDVLFYEPGSWGPEDADRLVSPQRWHLH